eukprot:9653464-Ditylum_brightwellii.AAC.1
MLPLLSCGSPIRRSITMSTGCNGVDCVRYYHLYLPSSRCYSDNSTNEDNDITSAYILPMVMALHCYGCTYQTMLEPWRNMAELKSFVLIVPEGLQNSWNAKYCCGHALKQNINDIEFLHLVIQDVVSSINQQQQQQGGEEQKNVLSLS